MKVFSVAAFLVQAPCVRCASTGSLGGKFIPKHGRLRKVISAKRAGGPLCALRLREAKAPSVTKKLDATAMTSSSFSNMGNTMMPTQPIPEDEQEELLERAQLHLLSDINSQTVHSPTLYEELGALVKARDATDNSYDETSSPLQSPRCTVFSDELDVIEKEFEQIGHDRVKRGQSTFREDEIYESTLEDDSELSDRSVGVAHDSAEARSNLRAAVRKSKFIAQYPQKAYSRGVAKIPVIAQEKRHARHVIEPQSDTDLPPEANVHFPCGGEPVEQPPCHLGTCATPAPEYDAYVTRPHDLRLVARRDVEWWDDFSNRSRVDDYARAQKEAVQLEYLQESPVDNVRASNHSDAVRKEALLFLRSYPANENIQDSFVRISEIVPEDGADHIRIPQDEQVDMPVAEARALARQHGLDLVRVAETHSAENSEQGVVGICSIVNHHQMMRRMIKQKLFAKGGIQPQRNPACVEVPFRGGTHPHAIRFKAIGIAKLLVRRTPVRINLTDFGTPSEGFPIFQIILDEIKKQCLPLKAFHRAGMLQSNFNEIYCFLFPSTIRNPKFGIQHPSPDETLRSRDQRIMENEKETIFDGYYDKPSLKERAEYARKIDEGFAWADRDDGLSLKRQRSMKVMLGYLPKGNHEIYAARGDVDVPAPFRTSHATSLDKWSYPRESNLEQASRASLVLGKRMSMDVSDMHAQGETEDAPSTVERFYYKVQGSALEVGELKEAFGLKTNRKKPPGLAPGWGTLGLQSSNGDERSSILK